MSIARVHTLAFEGIEPFEVGVEVHISSSIPTFTIVGLGDKAIYESRERIRSALNSCGFSFPFGKVIVNLSPASREKTGTHYDLPIALALLQAEKKIRVPENVLILGELGLDGRIVSVPGVLPSAVFAQNKNMSMIIPKANVHEAALVGISMLASDHITDLLQNLENFKIYKPEHEEEKQEGANPFTHIIGQEIAKRACVIAAAGRHHLLMIGSQGVGKSMLASQIVNLLPPLTFRESLDVSCIYSIDGKLNRLIRKPPFRSPHSSSSLTSITGGGNKPKPGELSLSHHGILFLDELPEFNQSVIDALRTPLEEQVIHISRSNYKVTYPASIQLVASMNPCKCGMLFEGICTCRRKDYMNKISGPVQDRIDLKVHLEKIKFSVQESFYEDPRKEIREAHEIQMGRYGLLNSRVKFHTLKESIQESDLRFLYTEMEKKDMSMRSMQKVCAIARTIADLQQSDLIHRNHILEAMFFKN